VETIRRFEDRIAWWVSQPDRGQTDALNKGLERATGDVIAYINSDDYYLPGAFDTAIGALERSGASWVAGAARFVDENGRLTEIWRPQQPTSYESMIRGRHWWILAPWSVPQPSAFWRRELYEEVGPFRRDMHYAFDTEFFLRLVYAGHFPALTTEELSVRVVHPAAKSADVEPFHREIRKLIEVLSPQLSPEERAKLALSRALLRVRPLVGPPLGVARKLASWIVRPLHAALRRSGG
jgi:glycosyltransferase involved in cell wall biosynthesis